MTSSNEGLEEILPCPGCGGANLVVIPYGTERSHEMPEDRSHEVVCDDCGWSGPEVAPLSAAIVAWNRRAPDTASQARVKVLETALVMIAHTETENSFGGSVNMPSSWYRDQARTALQQTKEEGNG